MGRNLGVYENYRRYGGGVRKKTVPQEGVYKNKIDGATWGSTKKGYDSIDSQQS